MLSTEWEFHSPKSFDGLDSSWEGWVNLVSTFASSIAAIPDAQANVSRLLQ